MKLNNDAHYRVMRLVGNNPSISQRQIASELGISLGGVNYCLKAMAEKEFAKIERFWTSPRKLSYSYILTHKGIREKARMTQDFLVRKMVEYEALRLEVERLEPDLSREQPVKAT